MNPISLLLIEDDSEATRIICSLIRMKLTTVRLFSADSGSAGLNLFKELLPEIVITDIHLPDVDGVTVARQVKALRPDTKVIVLTGYSNKRGDFNGIDIHSYFVKPTDFRELLVEIETCIGEVVTEVPDAAAGGSTL